MKTLILFILLALLSFPAISYASDAVALYKTCASCHGENGAKTASSYGAINAMTSEQLTAALNGYKAKTYGRTAKAVMERVVSKCSEDDIKTLSTYIPTLLTK